MKKFVKQVKSSTLLAFLLLPTTAMAGTKELLNPLTPGKTGGASGTENLLQPTDIVGRLVFVLLGTLGVISVAAIIFSGLRIALARGNNEQVQKGKAGLVWAIIGLLVAFLGYVVINFVLGFFTGVISAS